MCGWPYAERADASPAAIELLAAPIMADSRYLEQPMYFSDIVVRADSGRFSLQDLRGRSWAYNEPRSHSGYNVVRYLLATQQLGSRFFGSVIESGSHGASVDLILSGAADASAIDSTVLEAMCRERPEIAPQLRVIGTIGPSPAPPWVMRASLDRMLRDALRIEVLTVHETDEGRAILEGAGVQRFGAVDDRYYDTIREMAAIAATIDLKPAFSLLS
jgi:phosphonate transport system substrate-binding protein